MAVRLSLDQPSKLVLFSLVTLLSATILVCQTLLVAVPEELGKLGSLSRLQRAAAIWPGNPEIHYRIGLLRLYTFGETDTGEAVTQMREATGLSPLRAVYWRGLAWACQSVADEKCADQAARRVQTLAPMDPQAVWFIGNFYLRTHQSGPAMDGFRHLLQIAPEYDKYVFRLCDSLGCPEAPTQRLFTESTPQIELDYISYLAIRGDIDGATRLWDGFATSAIARGFSFPLGSVELYVDSLLQRGLGNEVRRVWADLEKLNIVRGDPDTDGNLVFNGDFEQPVLDSGLDWRQPDARYALVDMAAGSAYHGKRCMRVDFTVSRNESYLLTYQYVPLDPNTRYILSAYVRSEEITSDSGPQLEVYDPFCQACLSEASEPTIGTTSWHRIEVRFSTGPRTKLARIQVIRSPSRTYPMDITGAFWLDSVSLKRERIDESENRGQLRNGCFAASRHRQTLTAARRVSYGTSSQTSRERAGKREDDFVSNG